MNTQGKPFWGKTTSAGSTGGTAAHVSEISAHMHVRARLSACLCASEGTLSPSALPCGVRVRTDLKGDTGLMEVRDVPCGHVVLYGLMTCLQQVKLQLLGGAMRTCLQKEGGLVGNAALLGRGWYSGSLVSLPSNPETTCIPRYLSGPLSMELDNIQKDII